MEEKREDDDWCILWKLATRVFGREEGILSLVNLSALQLILSLRSGDVTNVGELDVILPSEIRMILIQTFHSFFAPLVQIIDSLHWVDSSIPNQTRSGSIPKEIARIDISIGSQHVTKSFLVTDNRIPKGVLKKRLPILFLGGDIPSLWIIVTIEEFSQYTPRYDFSCKNGILIDFSDDRNSMIHLPKRLFSCESAQDISHDPRGSLCCKSFCQCIQDSAPKSRANR
eukprot:TRINITY_DN22118_c0_g1_i1.p1 TRINITY_DN22118_c0_g1~~TRINITY_DN22118_c0_g1_i1.p1  ORF type:complete len:227 (+),score=15.85 TRINITY_DN22118_c0_g1_i1:27-707(+)